MPSTFTFAKPSVVNNSYLNIVVFMERCKILKRFSIRKLYSFSFVLMAGTMLLMYVFTDRYVILLLSWTIGVSMAVLLTIPYVLVGKYHRNVQVSSCAEVHVKA